MVVLSAFCCYAQSLLARVASYHYCAIPVNSRCQGSPIVCSFFVWQNCQHKLSFPTQRRPTWLRHPKELDCLKNVTVFSLFSGKYHVD